ncbi:MAG: hypothetical protein H6841_01730 [Planctomycetes bacterium]|nr:hypothetical protein [Planctomycetota bacterium]MCB9935555.1 hypothetical protein [Planctomycetota bacterium]
MEEFVEKQYGEQERFQRDPVTPTANTVYLRVKSEQVKGILGSKYAVPQGFVGLVEEKGGKSKVLMPGEETAGEFTAHLLRDRDVRIPFNAQKATTSDGFDASVNFELSVTPDITRRDTIDSFIEHNVEGRRHFDWPLLKAEVQEQVAAAVRSVIKEYSAQQLSDETQLQKVRQRIVDRCAGELQAKGLGELGLELGRVRSDDFERHRQDIADVKQQGERDRAKQEVQAAMLRDQLGQELSRQELEDFLVSAREEGLIKEHERKLKDLERKSELDKLEAEYREQAHSLEATLRKLVLEDKLAMDSIMLDKHVEVVKKLKSELSDDRIEVYINLIRDEQLKADLLHKLMLKNMSPEQLKAMAEIEAQKARQVELAISKPRLEPVREEHHEADTGKVKEGDSVRIAEEDTQAMRRPAEIDEEDVATVAASKMNEALGTSLTEVTEAVSVHVPETDELEEVDNEELSEVELQEAEKESSSQPEIDAVALVTSGRRVFAIDPLSQENLDNTLLSLDYDHGRLGSLRSVRVAGEGADRLILAGARNGVYTTLVQHQKANREYPIGPGVDARTGINAAVVYHGFIYATHSEFGLLRWPRLQPYSSAVQVMPELISKFSTTRNLQVFDNRLLFANGPSVMLLEATNDSGSTLRVAARYRGTRHEVTALAADDKYVLIADTAGDVFVWDPKSSEPPVLAFYAGTAISDLAATELKGGRRCLLVAIKRPVVPMLFRDGSTALEFTAPEPVRTCDVLNGTIIGLSRDRMRIFAWRETRPDWPAWQFQFTEPVLDVRLVPPGAISKDAFTTPPPPTGLKHPPGYR